MSSWILRLTCSAFHILCLFFSKKNFFFGGGLSPVHAQVYKPITVFSCFVVLRLYIVWNSKLFPPHLFPSSNKPPSSVRMWRQMLGESKKRERGRERRGKGKSIEALFPLWPLERESPEEKLSLVESPSLCFLNRNSCYVHYALTLLQYCGTPSTASPPSLKWATRTPSSTSARRLSSWRPRRPRWTRPTRTSGSSSGPSRSPQCRWN